MSKKRLEHITELFALADNFVLLTDAFAELGLYLVQNGIARYESKLYAHPPSFARYSNNGLVKLALSSFEINENILSDLGYAKKAGISSCHFLIHNLDRKALAPANADDESA